MSCDCEKTHGRPLIPNRKNRISRNYGRNLCGFDDVIDVGEYDSEGMHIAVFEKNGCDVCLRAATLTIEDGITGPAGPPGPAGARGERGPAGVDGTDCDCEESTGGIINVCDAVDASECNAIECSTDGKLIVKKSIPSFLVQDFEIPSSSEFPKPLTRMAKCGAVDFPALYIDPDTGTSRGYLAGDTYYDGFFDINPAVDDHWFYSRQYEYCNDTCCPVLFTADMYRKAFINTDGDVMIRFTSQHAFAGVNGAWTGLRDGMFAFGSGSASDYWSDSIVLDIGECVKFAMRFSFVVVNGGIPNDDGTVTGGELNFIDLKHSHGYYEQYAKLNMESLC